MVVLDDFEQQSGLLGVVIDSIPEGILAIDCEGKVIMWNRAVEEMTGVKKEDMLGKGEYAYAIPFYGERRPILVDILLGKGKEWERGYEKIDRKGQTLVAEGFVPRAYGGRGFHFWTIAAPIFDQAGNMLGAIQCVRDISERKRMEQELRQKSMYDGLTGLYNRTFFEEELRRLEKSRSFPISLILCDIDGLKIANDTYGHEQGDALLCRAARVLASCVRGGDLAARIGGDEFALVLPNTELVSAEEIAGRISQAVEKDNLQYPQLALSLSVGAAAAENPDCSLLETYKDADDAMYRDKLVREAEPRGAVIRVLRGALSARDGACAEHSDRVKKLACQFGKAVGLSRMELNKLRLLADMHDIGKLGVREQVLFKGMELTTEENAEFRQHPAIGRRIALASPELAPVADLIGQHHEWWNGQGYPHGLCGEEIHLLCRLLAPVDVYDNLTSAPPLGRLLSPADALAKVQAAAGTQFDPQLVTAFVRLMSEQE